jgi:hypothetical protein
VRHLRRAEAREQGRRRCPDQLREPQRQPIPLRDLPALMSTGAELLALATGSPTQIISSGGDTTQIERCLRESDAETRALVLRGLRAALEWTKRHKQSGR